MSFEADTLIRVIDRHGLTNEQLGRASNISPGQISRCLSGQYSVPAALVRAVIDLTHDPELATLLSTESVTAILVPIEGRSMDLREAYIRGIQSTQDIYTCAAELFAAQPTARPTAQRLATSIDDAICALTALKRVINTEAAA